MSSSNILYIVCILLLSALTVLLIVVNDSMTELPTFASMQQLSDNDTMIAMRFEYRNIHLLKQCTKYGLDRVVANLQYLPKPIQFMVFTEIKLVWCPVYKAASSSWLQKFNLLDGFPPKFLEKTDINKIKLARTMHPTLPIIEVFNALEEYLSFIIVRHPFERLVSGYCDKLARPNEYYREKYGKDIIKFYRKRGYKPPNPEYPTFPEFVNWINDLAREGRKIDEHFAAITTWCTPCLTPYDYILKVETLNEDEQFFLNAIDIPELISFDVQNHRNCSNETIETLFGQLSLNQLKRLHRYYKFDFDLFDYSASEYYDLVK